VTRHLEARAAAKAPAALREEDGEGEGKNVEIGSERSLSIVVLTHPQPALSPAHAHIPTLLHLSTLSSNPGATSSQTRLVALPTSTDARLAANLHIPRVGAVGIYEGAPGAKALEDYVRQHVGLTECPWVDEAMRAEWKGLNVVGGKAKGQA
jgi:ribonuclease P/MRP protein subunit POP3